MASSLASIRSSPLSRLRQGYKKQEREASDLPEELQEFRLPVLQRVAHHQDEITVEVGRLLMALLRLNVGEPAERPVPHEADEEKPPVTQATPFGTRSIASFCPRSEARQ